MWRSISCSKSQTDKGVRKLGILGGSADLAVALAAALDDALALTLFLEALGADANAAEDREQNDEDGHHGARNGASVVFFFFHVPGVKNTDVNAVVVAVRTFHDQSGHVAIEEP